VNPSIYKRPNKPKRVDVEPKRRAPERAQLVVPAAPIIVDRVTECHVTPPHVAELMTDCLDPCEDHHVIEPSAGTGNLISALLDSGHPADRITAVERHLSLVDTLHTRFAEHPLKNIHGSCFLDYVEPENIQTEPVFQRAIVNPPFSKTKRHMQALINLLSQSPSLDWSLVALVPITYNHPDAELIEILPDDTFSLAKVNTKVIRIRS